MKVVNASQLYHDGRGPELIRVHIAEKSSQLLAVDFYAPDSSYGEKDLKHLHFINAQTYMFTPEEVHNYSPADVNWSQTGNGALVSLGQSAWLNSFSPRHLDNCQHFHAMFYDEFLDVICEGINVVPGGYRNGL